MKLASTWPFKILTGKYLLFSFILLFNLSPYTVSQNIEPRFEHLTVKDGLAEGTVKAILQDYLGYMWFFTQQGLVRYDGCEMTIYKGSLDSTGISGPSVMTLYEDRDKNLWIGTWASGLNRFNRATESFKHYIHNAKDPESISDDMIYSIYEDRKGRLWIGTDAGLDLLDRTSGKFNHFYFSDRSYSKEIYDYLLKQKKSNLKIESMLKVGNNADLTKTFIVKKKMQVLIVSMGEAGYDYGWLEDSKGNILFNYDYKKTLHAGGAFNNRIQCELLTLNEGIYELHYTSNYFYSYEDKFQRNNSFDYDIRTGKPPDFPEFWGIQVLDASADIKKIEELLGSFSVVNVKSKIFSIIENEINGKIYIGTNSPGLWELDEETRGIKKGNLPYKNKSLREIGSIESFYKARDGNIWIATTVGLCKYNLSNSKLDFYQPTPVSKDIFSNHLNSIAEDNNGNIWVGTVISGLLNFDVKEEKFYNYITNPNDPFSISSDRVLCVYVDRSGILWTGLWGTGTSKWDRKKWKFQSYGKGSSKENIFSNKVINTIYEDKNRDLWLGTFTGLYKYNRFNNQLKHFNHSTNSSNTICSDSVVYILGDKFNPAILWIGTKNGLNQFDTQSESFMHYRHKLGDSTSLDNNIIRHLLIDNEGILWVGTYSGLNRFDRSIGKFTHYTGYNQAEGLIGSSVINFIFEDHLKRLWISYSGVGLLEFDRKNESIKSYMSDIGSEYYLFSVESICEDKKRNLWLGEFMTGLNLFDRDKEAVTQIYTTDNGLIDNRVLSMTSDVLGNLWLTSHSGLTRFDPEKRIFKHYNKSEGIVDLPTERWFPFYNGSSGEIFFCGKEGFNIFNPNDIVDDPVPPNVIIKKVSLFNRPEEKIEYDGFISELEKLTLPYNQNDLHIEYVGFHYGEPLKNQYKYILEGFDDNWIDVGNQRTATYTNLDPGKYVFRVKAANRDGVWNEMGASIRIIINPPLWATTWAYLIYALAFISLLYFTWKLQVKRIKVKHEFEMSRFESQKLHEVDEMKSRFFTNISHEFRTPLTLILGPVKQVIEKLNEGKMKDDLSMVHRNANKLLGLVNQLLDISKLESGNMKLQTVSQNIIPLLKALVLSFTSYAERKSITLRFNSTDDEIIVYLDKDKIEKIFTNILSNAFKFTPDGGRIEANVNRDNGYLKVSITDSGIGIPKEKLARIFDRFYQVDGSHTREQEGTGIGLSLTEELVELHKGKIEVESEEGKGTTFTVSLPLGKDHLKTG